MAVSSERGLFSQAWSARDRQARVWAHRIIEGHAIASSTSSAPRLPTGTLASFPSTPSRSFEAALSISCSWFLDFRATAGAPRASRGAGARRAPRVVFWCGFWKGFILVSLPRCCCKFSTIFVERTKKLGFVDEFCEIFVRYLLWLLVARSSHSALPRHLQPAGSCERPMILWGGRPEWVARSAFWGSLVSKGAA